MSAAYLPEIPENEATGSIATVYDEIRRTIGIPLVNLVYRHLAVSPGRLESIWTALKPNLLHPQTAQGAERLANAAVPANVFRVPPTALAAIGVDQKELNSARETVDVYMHANPRNLLVFSSLLHPSDERQGEPPAQVSVPGVSRTATLPPMVDLKGVAGPTRDLLNEMSAPIVAPGEATLVPSLFRHFASNPPFLALLWTALQPAVIDRSIAVGGTTVAREARELASRLPYRVHPLEDESTREILERFSFTICRMIVVGGMLRLALAGSKDA